MSMSPPSGAQGPQAGILAALDARLSPKARRGNAPVCGSFEEFLTRHARVLQRDGTAGPFSLEGRAPLALVVDWLDNIVRNTVGDQSAPSSRLGTPPLPSAVASAKPGGPRTADSLRPATVAIDGIVFAPGQLKGATVAVAGGAQFGKTILELNLMAYATAIRFLSFGNYLPDRPKVEEIVGQKFRPNVLDLYPWMAELIQLGKTENASGKTIDRKESFTVTDGERKSFGNFCGMHKPPTSITIDLAVLDEVDDIPDRNVGYVDARMTNSPLHLTCFIGTQRIDGAGQNARLKASSFHVRMVPCPSCGREWCLEEEWPRCVRVRKVGPAVPGEPQLSPVQKKDPVITPEMGHDRLARYYVACPECAAPLDRDSGRYVARNPERIAQARLGLRVSQLNISAISMQEIVGAWYAAMEDPSGNAMAAFHCDRIAIPHAGAAQPITQAVLDHCRSLGMAEREEAAQGYAMSLGGHRSEVRAVGGAPRGAPSTQPPPGGFDRSDLRPPTSVFRVAGMDLGPRCWFWCDELRGPLVSACVWAELIASGNATTRVPLLMQTLGIACLFLDAGGEPDLTKRLVLALNGLENYQPPVVPRAELLKTRLSFPLPRETANPVSPGRPALRWDGETGRWSGLRAAAVLFVAGEARGVEQTLGFTQDGRIYPLIKCHRDESIQTAVNDFLTPAQGVIELVRDRSERPDRSPSPDRSATVRALPRARLPMTCIGAGVSQAILDGHLLNLRKERDPKTGEEDWIEGVENHLGLAKCYARLAAMVAEAGGRSRLAACKPLKLEHRQAIGAMGLGKLTEKIPL